MSSPIIDTISHEDGFPAHDTDSTRPHSIDLTLELERQLEAESLPTSPVDPNFSHTRSHSLDPQVLASIVTQLRSSLTDVTRERDELASLLTEVQNRESGLTEALHQTSEKYMKTEAELLAAQDRQKEDQDAIAMLRSKLEDSRRALMRLQTENRRISQGPMTIDTARAGPSTLSGPPSSRRSSFAPLTGSAAGRINAHRRISSVSDSGTYYGEHGQLLGSPRPVSQLEPLHLLSNSAPTSTNGAPVNNRRVSGFFSRSTPTPELGPPVDASEAEELRKELQSVKEQLEETRHELTETREAQEASETCVNALRTFIAENSIGMHPPGAPAVPAARPSVPATPTHRNNNSTSSSKWSFRLWNTPTNTATPNSSPALPPTTTSSTSAPPLGRKLGGFFASRGSMSSTSSALPPPHSHQQEPMCNGSDSSSDDSGTEPVSPASELPGATVLVQSQDRSLAGLVDSPVGKKTELEVVDLDQGRVVTVS